MRLASAPPTRSQAYLRDQRGAAAIEFAMISPVLLLILVSTIDFGIGFYRKMQVQSASQRGAVYATIKGYDATAIASAITGSSAITASPAPRQFCGCATGSGITEISGAACSAPAPACTGGAGNAGTYVSSSATATYQPVLKYPYVQSQFTFVSTDVVRIQ